MVFEGFVVEGVGREAFAADGGAVPLLGGVGFVYILEDGIGREDLIGFVHLDDLNWRGFHYWLEGNGRDRIAGWQDGLRGP